MLTVLVVIAVLLVLFVAAAAATHEGDLLLEAPADAADVVLPAGPMQPEDVTEIRFGLAFRGYRMAEVDDVLSRLQHELAARDARIGELEGALVDIVEPAVAEVEQGFAPVEAPPVEVWTRPVQAVTWPGIAAPAAAASTSEEVLAPFGAEDFPEVLAAEPAATDLPDAVETPTEALSAPDVSAETPEVPAEAAVPAEVTPELLAELAAELPAEVLPPDVPAEQAQVEEVAPVPAEAPEPAEPTEAPTAPLGDPDEGFARPNPTNPPA